MIAVLGVVLYHFGVPGLSGGFTGVDVFFVISGFLIGGILWRDLSETGQVSLARFFTRRVKRLAPAYFAMAIISALVAWIVLLPFEFREYGKELISATVYLSNFLFWRGEGYFDIGSDNKVLLHTWSLSVEEQFYIFLPLLILVLKFSRRLLILGLIAAFLFSLIANIAFTPTQQTATFYLFPFRAWELLAGVLLSVVGFHRGSIWAFHPALSWLGLALIFASLTFTEPASFPGWQALFPVAGTVLLLSNGQQHNIINHVLASPVPVFFGKISYSLYLWHWPVLVFSKYWCDGYSSLLESASWLALSIALATLSWALIETPFRRFSPSSGWRVLTALAVSTSATLGFGAVAYVTNGLPERFGPVARAHIAASADFLQDWSRCHTPNSGPFSGVRLCPIGPEGPPEVLIWGDSHVRAIKQGLEQAARQANSPGLIIWQAGCPPLFGIDKHESYATPAEDAACLANTTKIRNALSTLDSINTVLLVGRWTYYVEGKGSGVDAENTIELSGFDGSNSMEVLSRARDVTLSELSQNFSRLFVLRQPPEIRDYDSRKTARLLAHHHIPQNTAPVTTALSVAQARSSGADFLFRPSIQSGVLTQIDPWPQICNDDTCSAQHDSTIWYFDNNHLTNTAARALTPILMPLFETTK